MAGHVQIYSRSLYHAIQREVFWKCLNERDVEDFRR